MTNRAAIDCGTNSTRLLIADERGVTLQREMRITRLGKGVDATGELAADALARTYEVLDLYSTMMIAHSVTASKLIATSAARDASNGKVFLNEAQRRTGASVALLTGDVEAELSYRGATADLSPSEEPVLIVDIGGGSTELAAIWNDDLVSYSMQLGCVRLSERVLGAGLVTPETAERANELITDELNRAFVAKPEFESMIGNVRLVGLAGTVSTLAQLDAGLSEYQRDVVHHRVLTLADVARWKDLLGSELPAQRLARPGMVPGREDVLVSGLFVLEAVMRRFAVTSLISSESDILDGLIASMAEDGGT